MLETFATIAPWC